MEQVRVAIIGMGIGRNNGLAIAANPRGQVVALCDLVPEKMEQFAAELATPVRRFTDYRDLCQDPDIDAVFVGTPNQSHVPIAMEAVRCRKHVMVTKPLADSEGAAAALVEAAEAAGVVNMMSLSTRFCDEVRYLGGLREAGEFGQVYYGHASSVRRSGIPDWSLGFIQKGGGAFRDMGVHALDAAWWLLGMPKPEAVLGVAGAKFGPIGRGYWDFAQPEESFWRQYNSDDYGGGFIRFADGTGLQIESFWASHQPGQFQIDLFGTEGGARLDPLTVFRTVNGVPQDISIKMPKQVDPFANVADHFIACIADGVPCQAPLRHGLIVQQMMEGLLRSAVTGQEVRFA